ncbi:discoidin domain-containing protein [Sunxiuqinia sp. A32]|uniref:discoidin domain-containing protein n=1 Tax=Sunxiuqinia sp. A32 TaxID=3461496 RepID=UPI004045B69E
MKYSLFIGLIVLITLSCNSKKTYENIALNKSDVHESVWEPEVGYPHASSSSEYEMQSCFFALNAINGDTINNGHGPDFPSWGPDKVAELWWNVDFGHEYEVNKVVIYIRADFPHDDYWNSANLVFSNGEIIPIKITKSAKKQEFKFSPQTTSSITISNLEETPPLGWCSFTEVEVWGYK